MNRFRSIARGDARLVTKDRARLGRYVKAPVGKRKRSGLAVGLEHLHALPLVEIDDDDGNEEPGTPTLTTGGNDEDTTTFGVGATFVSSAKVPEEVIYQVVKAVFEDFDQFKKLHPAFEVLKKEEMVKDGLSAPLHDGSVKYFKEAGLLK